MAEERLNFEDEKSKELYELVSKEWSSDKLASNPLFIVECVGALKLLSLMGYKYHWIDGKMKAYLLIMKIFRPYEH